MCVNNWPKVVTWRWNGRESYPRPRARSPTELLIHVVGVGVQAVCLNGGTCRDVGASHRCDCRHGYEGSYCEADVDECQSQPCSNGARCVDLVGRYHCDCPLGYQVLHSINHSVCQSIAVSARWVSTGVLVTWCFKDNKKSPANAEENARQRWMCKGSVRTKSKLTTKFHLDSTADDA